MAGRKTALVRLVGWLVGWVAAGLLVGGCAHAGVQTGICDDDNPCNPGYHCFEGTCVAGDLDGGAPDAFYIPPSDALPPDAEILCAVLNISVTETEEHFEVPANVRYMHVKAWGAGGNGTAGCNDDGYVLGLGNGGRGGYTEAIFSLAAGTPLIVIVGKSGSESSTPSEIVRFGFGLEGGGGLSGIFLGPDPIDEFSSDRALLIAGGGGSAGVGPNCDPGGTGNHPGAGGMPTMLGGDGGAGWNGGGGGYFGGAGGSDELHAMGGTGFVDGSATVDFPLEYVEPGDNPAPKSDEPEYDDIELYGVTESSGFVHIEFICELPPPL